MMKLRYTLITLGLAVFAASVSIAQTLGVNSSLRNSGFESPSIAEGSDAGVHPREWNDFASDGKSSPGITEAQKRNGTQAVELRSLEQENSFMGIAQKFRAESRYRYTFSVFVKKDVDDPLSGSSFGQVSVEWYDADGKEINRIYGQMWNHELSATRWEQFVVDATAPDGVDYGMATITFFSGDSGGWGTCYIDDADMQVKSP